jgi:hypothetical protein
MSQTRFRCWIADFSCMVLPTSERKLARQQFAHGGERLDWSATAQLAAQLAGLQD